MRLLLPLVALVATGCFVDSLGLPPPVGGSADGGSAAANGGAGGAPVTAGGGGAGQGGIATIGGSGEGGAGGDPQPQHCPPGEIATDIADGVLECASPADSITAAIAESCAVFYGWRDNCDAGCTNPPDRFGKVTSTSCVEPASGDSSCQVVDLGADLQVQLFGFDLDGNPDNGDRFYSAISCAPGSASSVPCDGSGFVTAYADATPVCSRISGAALDYVQPSCGIVRGWADQCSGSCTSITKIVGSTTTGCDTGIGGYCADVTLGSDMVKLASFDTDGDPGDDDRFYFGLRCQAVRSAEAPATDACPAGQFVVGLEVDGTLVCSDLQEVTRAAFRARCALFAGWRDACDACTNPPTKWGRVREGECINNAAADDSCSTTMVGGQNVSLYGLNLDGGVDGNDKFYLGFRCE